MSSDGPGREIPDDSNSNEDLEGIEQICDAFLDSLRAGKPIDRQDLVDSHPGLAPNLESRLKLVEAVFYATRPKAGPGQSTDAPSETVGKNDDDARDNNSHTSSGDLFEPEISQRIRCPHCGNLVQLTTPHLGEITCASCGSSVLLKDEDTATDIRRNLPLQIGRFAVERLLGQGAFGLVYLANDPKLDRKIAIKVPRQGFFVSAEEELRFFREARNAARLQHSNIVQIHEISENGGAPYIVSDFIDGLTLSDLASGGLLTFEESVRFIVQVSRAVHFAHSNGIIHRDLKPSNILIDLNKKAFVADFGLARRDDAEITMTMQGMILGTPAYMAPEQASGQHDRVDVRSDVYSLGVILYRLLCQELPFHGTKRMLLKQVIHDEPRSPRRLNENVPRDLETITLKAISKQRSQRYQTAAEYADELERWLRNEPIQARPISRVSRFWRWCQRNPRIAGLTATIAFLLFAAAISAVIVANREQTLRKIADDNFDASMENRNISENRLKRLMKINGQTALQRNDLFQSYYWFSNARKIRDSKIDRLRLGLLADRLPKLTNLLSVDGDILEIRFNSEGTRCAVGTRNGRVLVFDTFTGQKTFEQRTSGTSAYQLAFAGRNHIVFQSSLNHAQIWDMVANRMVSQLSHTDFIHSIDVSTDGEQIATGSADGSVKIWRNVDGSETAKLELDGYRGRKVAFTPQSDKILIRADQAPNPKNLLYIWNWQEGEGETISIPQEGTILSWDIAPDETCVITTTRNLVRAWNLKTGAQVGKSLASEGKSWSTAFFHHGSDKALVLSQDNLFAVYDLETGALVKPGIQTNFPITSFARNASRRIVACSSNEGFTKVFWGPQGIELCTQLPNSAVSPAITFHPDGRQVAIEGADGVIRIWDLAGSIPSGFLFEHKDDVMNVAFSPDGSRCFTIGLDGNAYIWDTITGQQVGKPMVHKNGVYQCEVSPNGRFFATVSSDYTARVWDAHTGEAIGDVLKHESPPIELGFHPDSEMLVTGCFDGTVALWEIKTTSEGEAIPIIVAKHNDKIRRVLFSASGDLILSAGFDGFVKLSDLTGTQAFGPFRLNGRAWDCDMLPDENHILTTGGRSTLVWNIDNNQQPISELTGYPEVKRARFTKEHVVSSNGEGKGQLWDLRDPETPELLFEFEHRAIDSCNWMELNESRDMILFAGGRTGNSSHSAQQGAVVIYSFEDGKELAPPLFHNAEVRFAHFGANGTKLLTASEDNSAWLIFLDPTTHTQENEKQLAGLWFQTDVTRSADQIVDDYGKLKATFSEQFTTSSREIELWNRKIKQLSQMDIATQE